MSGTGWPALDAVLAALRTEPSRTGSVIATVYGDAILPRGGSLALADLLVLMRRLGAGDGVVRTAVSRLAKDGVLQGRRAGRHSAYALTPRAAAEFAAAVPQIYGCGRHSWDGRLHLAFPESGADRSALEAAGFALLAPGILVSPSPVPDATLALEATGPDSTVAQLAARAWPVQRLGELFEGFTGLFAAMLPVPRLAPLEAMAARTVLIHAWRRIALRDPQLPSRLLPAHWPGGDARRLCVELYAALVPTAEAWLDATSAGLGPLPPGPDPNVRFNQDPQTTTPSPAGEGASPMRLAAQRRW